MPIRTFASTSTTPVAVAIDEDVALSLLIEDKVLAPMVREVAEIWPEWPITLPHDATSHPLPPPIPPPPPPQTRTRKDKRKRDGGVAADARALAAETRAHAESAALLDAKQRILALEMIQVPESELTPDAARRRRDRWRGWTLEIVPAEEAEGGREPSPTGSVLVDGVRRSRRRKTVMPEWVLWERPPKDREEVEVNREEPLPPVQPFQTSHKHPRLQAFGAAHPSPPRSDE
jgi:hypothetical protein